MNTPSKQLFWYGLALLTTTLILHSCREKEPEPLEKPNILFILSDDHTSQAWGIYGGILADYVQNGNISRLADEGAVFEQCILYQ